MSQSLVSIRMDEDLKKSFDSVCNDLGLNMSTAITIFAKKMSREKRIPFDVSLDTFYSESNVRHIYESLDQLKAGKIIVKRIEDLEEMENE